jgi:hypothetical protein
MDIFHKLLGTAPLSVEQWAITIAAGVSLFIAWEIGKLVVRRSVPASETIVAVPAPAA